jgi:superfamily II DNA or RNA helicase
MSYHQFLEEKSRTVVASGFTVNPEDLNPHLFAYQRAIVHRALSQGKFCIWADCGLGKTLQQLVWADEVSRYTNMPVLILAPLAVSSQTIREGGKFGIKVNWCEDSDDVINGINITNYEKLERFDASVFSGVVLDESSILKAHDSKYRTYIINVFERTPYKLACSATPSPNDIIELGNHAQFLGVMTREEMLAMYFTHDGGRTSNWRLKKHAADEFWKFVCGWAVMVRQPSDLGFSDDGFKLPELVIHDEAVSANVDPPDGMLFWINADSLNDQRHIRKESIQDRCNRALEIVKSKPNEQWLIWCNLNGESRLLKDLIGESFDCVEITGSDTDKHKIQSMIDFQDGKLQVLVTKPSIAGFGMNWQNCSKIIFVGLSHSYEEYYQAVRRCWRFGQNHPVHVHIIYEEREGSVIANIKRKDKESGEMAVAMVNLMKKESMRLLGQTSRIATNYKAGKRMVIPDWLISA